MAEIDKAPLPYRAVIEFWWFLEKWNTNRCLKYMEKSDWEKDPPVWLQNIGVFFMVRRKRAEHRALVKIGFYRKK